jgi:DNA-binding IclR family transcriptional regulator
MARSTSGEGVLERAVRILEVFDGDTAVASITDIATRADLPLSTASRLVDELIGHGFLLRDNQRRVRIGIRLWELGCRASPTSALRDAAMPFLQQLHAAIGQDVQIGILESHDVLFIERLSTTGSVRSVTCVGSRLPLHASASGLALLAFAPTQLQHRILSGPLIDLTNETVTDRGRLCVMLAEIRRVGFVVAPGFVDPEATAIAVPIKDARGNVIAALSAVLPRDSHASRRIPALLSGAERIRGALVRGSFPQLPTTRLDFGGEGIGARNASA